MRLHERIHAMRQRRRRLPLRERLRRYHRLIEYRAEGESKMTLLDKVVINATYRVNQAVPHLLGAARFSRAVKAVEAANKDQSFGEYWEEMRDFSTACIFLADAATESYVNELIADREQFFADDVLKKIDWESLEWKSTWKKFNVALRLRGKQELDRRSEISRAALAVNELRNAMTHFKPEWHHDLKKHKDVGDALAGFFVPNPTFANEPIFPRAWVGHSCTCWVVDSTVKFLQEFERLADLPKRTDWPALQGRLQA